MNNGGFTLIEVLLSVAILTLLTGLSLPVYESFVRRNDLDLTAQTIASTIRRAETYARGVNEDSTWGVRFTSPTTTLFKGTTYATRDATYDEIVTIPNSMTMTGTSEVVFSKLSAIPNTTASIDLNSTTNDTRTITVNAGGAVEY
jgi:prepilin-type N-terminal cleavage/methylation domain-containing protein